VNEASLQLKPNKSQTTTIWLCVIDDTHIRQHIIWMIDGYHCLLFNAIIVACSRHNRDVCLCLYTIVRITHMCVFVCVCICSKCIPNYICVYTSHSMCSIYTRYVHRLDFFIELLFIVGHLIKHRYYTRLMLWRDLREVMCDCPGQSHYICEFLLVLCCYQQAVLFQ